MDIWKQALQESTILHFNKGQVIFYQGHQPYGIFVIKSGSVVFTSQDHEEKEIHLLAPQKMPIGIDFIMGNETYPYSAVACSDVVVFFINKTFSYFSIS